MEDRLSGLVTFTSFTDTTSVKADEVPAMSLGGLEMYMSDVYKRQVSTSCGGSEPLFEKMKRLIKSENLKTPADKGKEVRYNEDSNLSVGRRCV